MGHSKKILSDKNSHVRNFPVHIQQYLGRKNEQNNVSDDV